MIAQRRDFPAGRIEVITGGMFSGKSEELVRRLRRALIARQRVQVFKPLLDSRHGPDRVVTRDGREVAAQAVVDTAELSRQLLEEVDVVGIDEAQFFDAGIVALVTELADRGVRVLVAGLDQDYRREPFGPMPGLMALAEHVDKMHAVCVTCGAPAHYSQRLSGGGDQILVGDSQAYEARCRECFEPYEPRR
jgi:thymidine kinase